MSCFVAINFGGYRPKVSIYVEQILRGCKALNDAKIIHCDLKPENILIVGPKEDLRIKIIDLGSAVSKGKRSIHTYNLAFIGHRKFCYVLVTIQQLTYGRSVVLLPRFFWPAFVSWSF